MREIEQANGEVAGSTLISGLALSSDLWTGTATPST